MAADGAPIQYAFDPAPHPRGRFSLGHPDWIDDTQHRLCIDLAHRHLADHRVGVVPQRVDELLAVLGVAPPALMLIEVTLRGFGEGDRRRLRGGFLCALSAPVVNRIYMIGKKLPLLARATARFLQRESARLSQPHPSLATVDLEPEQP